MDPPELQEESTRLIFGNWELFGLGDEAEDIVQEWFLLTSPSLQI